MPEHVDRHPKTQILLLTAKNKGTHFPAWKKAICVLLQATELPTKYYNQDVFTTLDQLIKEVKKPEENTVDDVRQWMFVEGKIENIITMHLDSSVTIIWDNSSPNSPAYTRFKAFEKGLLHGADANADRLGSAILQLIQGDRTHLEFAVEFQALWNELNAARKNSTTLAPLDTNDYFTDYLRGMKLGSAETKALKSIYRQESIDNIHDAVIHLETEAAEEEAARVKHQGNLRSDVSSNKAHWASKATHKNTKSPPTKKTMTLCVGCTRDIRSCHFASKGLPCPKCPKCHYYGHVGKRCCDDIVEKCKAAQGDTPKVPPAERKVNSLVRGDIILDGSLYEDEILVNKVMSSVRYSNAPLDPSLYACLDSGATGHIFKTRPRLLPHLRIFRLTKHHTCLPAEI
jgi:hypothetical protein